MVEISESPKETLFAPTPLERHFHDLQSIVDRHMRQSGLSVNDMALLQIVEFSRRLSRYVEFEAEAAAILKDKMSLNFAGAGGFIVVEANGKVVGSQDMSEGDTMTGVYDSCVVLAVPSLKSMLESADSNMISPGDNSLSAGLVLNAATFRPHGRYSKPYDFDDKKVIVPLVYGMKVLG